MDTVAPSVPLATPPASDSDMIANCYMRLVVLSTEVADIAGELRRLSTDLAPIIATVRQLQQIPRVAKAIRNADAR